MRRFITISLLASVWQGAAFAAAQGVEQAPSQTSEKLQVECQPAPAFAKKTGVETADEKAARYEDDFRKALMVMDKCINKVAEGAASAGGGGGGGGGGQGAGQAGGSGLKGTDRPAEATPSGSTASAAGEASDPAEPPTQNPEQVQQAPKGGVTPPDIPDGRNDDVVARQLRELAEREPDPVLRKKYWNQYRKYIGQKPVD